MSSNESYPIGEVIYIAVKPIFKIYMIIGVGFYLSRMNILTVDTSRNISTIAIKVLIPCLTFQKIVSNLNNTLIHEIATIVIIGYFMMFSQAIIIFLAGVLVGCPRNWWGGLILCGLSPNIADLPIAYLQSMQTANIFTDVDLGVSFIMIYMGLQMLLQFTFGSYKLIEYDFKIDEKMQKNNNNNEDIEMMNTQLDHITDFHDHDHDDDNDDNITNSINSNNIQKLDQIPSSIQNFAHEVDEFASIDSASSLNSVNSTNFHKILRTTSKIIQNITNTSNNSLSKHQSRLNVPVNLLQNEQAHMPSEDLNDIVRVYSKYNELKEESPIPLISNTSSLNTIKKFPIFQKIIKTFKSINWKNLFWIMIDIWKDSFKQPTSVVLVLSITIAMIPWVQALFVFSPQVTLPNAPDQQPPLSFIMDFAGYIGAAQVPFGLILLGGTIGRLRINNIPLKMWRIPITVTFLRLFIFPIIGCAFNSKIYSDGLFYGQDILYFISNINFCLPPATTLLYITAFYTPTDGKNHIQMDILALVYIFNYTFLIICLPFTATYTMKVSLGF
jgi:predicted permease